MLIAINGVDAICDKWIDEANCGLKNINDNKIMEIKNLKLQIEKLKYLMIIKI